MQVQLRWSASKTASASLHDTEGIPVRGSVTDYTRRPVLNADHNRFGSEDAEAMYCGTFDCFSINACQPALRQATDHNAGEMCSSLPLSRSAFADALQFDSAGGRLPHTGPRDMHAERRKRYIDESMIAVYTSFPQKLFLS